jgi:hypothetical protein
VQVQTPITQAQARTTAQTYLRRAAALTESWDLTCVPDPSLELGDVITLEAQQRTSTQVIASLNIPLTVNGSMTITTRALSAE